MVAHNTSSCPDKIVLDPSHYIYLGILYTLGMGVVGETCDSSRLVLRLLNRCSQKKVQYDTSHYCSPSLHLFSAHIFPKLLSSVFWKPCKPFHLQHPLSGNPSSNNKLFHREHPPFYLEYNIIFFFLNWLLSDI